MTNQETQQKAAELVNRYLSLGISFQRSKLCALIACNELVELAKDCDDFPAYEKWVAIRNEIEAMSDEQIQEREYKCVCDLGKDLCGFKDKTYLSCVLLRKCKFAVTL